MSEIQQVNIKEVFASKNAALARFIPEFLFRYIEKVIHQDEINRYLWKFGHLDGLPFVDGSLKELGATIQVVGTKNFPDNPHSVFISNHPIGGLDGLILMRIIGQQYGDVRVIINDLLMNIKNLQPLFIPINKHGANSREYVEKMEQVFASNIPIMTFPSGMCSRKINGKIVDLEWRKNFLQKSIEHQRDIVPIFTEGRNSDFFYNLSNIRKRLGIKINIEMFYLVDELYQQQSKTIRCTIGKLVSWKMLKNIPTRQALAALRNNVYALSTNPEATFEP